LVAVLGSAASTLELSRDVEGLDLGDRQALIDEWLPVLAGSLEADVLVQLLVSAGVPASVVIEPAEVAVNPQIAHRGLFEFEEHPLTGRHRLPGLPFSMGHVDSWIRRPAPMLGQHNDEVLDELGIDSARRAVLREHGIIGESLASG
jgi:crotonobetainyl-CoA:carnitine CoA-transferase CaiB-like acyl-CoA transferase